MTEKVMSRPYVYHSDYQLGNALIALATSLANEARQESNVNRAAMLWSDRDLCREAGERLQMRETKK